MKFEFDPNKSVLNKQKHGIDFIVTQLLWKDSTAIEISARTTDEVRKLLIAELNQEIWSAVYTIREERIRIISVRRARKNEKEIYYSTRI